MDGPDTKKQIVNNIKITGFSSLSASERARTLTDIKRIEKKTFPRSEAFDFDTELSKANTRMLVCTSDTQVLGYLVYLRLKRNSLLHKICVDSAHRGQCIGGALLDEMIIQIPGDSIQLWVDVDRTEARGLYDSRGFRLVSEVKGYYGPGRDAMKMVRDCPD